MQLVILSLIPDWVDDVCNDGLSVASSNSFWR